MKFFPILRRFKVPVDVLTVLMRFVGGGAEKSVEITASALNPDIISMHRIACNEPLLGEPPPISTVLSYSRNRLSTVLQGSKKLSLLIKSEQPDIVHVHCELPELVCVLAYLQLPKVQRPPLVITEHTRKPWIRFPFAGRVVRNLALRLGGKFVPCFPPENEFPYEVVIRNPIEVSPGSIGKVSQFRRVIVIGRLHRSKQVIRILEAIAATDSSIPILIIGDGPERPALEKFAEQHLENCHFAGYQPSPWGCAKSGDIFISASEYEGDPLTLCEALIKGIPVLVSDIDAHRDLVESGSLFKNADELAHRLLDLRAGATTLLDYQMSDSEQRALRRSRDPKVIADTWQQVYLALSETSELVS